MRSFSPALLCASQEKIEAEPTCLITYRLTLVKL